LSFTIYHIGFYSLNQLMFKTAIIMFLSRKVYETCPQGKQEVRMLYFTSDGIYGR